VRKLGSWVELNDQVLVCCVLKFNLFSAEECDETRYESVLGYARDINAGVRGIGSDPTAVR
jgi:hypothetical protein